MIYYDNIVSSINGGGGISVLFKEIYSRLSSTVEPYFVIEPRSKVRFSFERFRRCDLSSYPININDIFHSTYYRLPNRALKTVTTVHDFTYEKNIKGLKSFIHSEQKRKAIIESDAIICVSENTKKDLLEFLPSVHESKINIVYNGVSDSYFPLYGEHYTKNVLFVGQRAGYKNFTSLVKALSMLPDLNLQCVGGGRFSNAELSMLKKYIPNRYEHLGYMSEMDLNISYNRAFCLVYPSLYEGFGIPIVEAMKAGCPVIAANNSSIPEVAAGAVILTENGWAEEIQSSLLSLYNESIRESYKTKGFIRANDFSWDINFAETMKVYKSIVD